MLKGRIVVATKTTSDGLVAMALREKTNTIEGRVSRKLFFIHAWPYGIYEPEKHFGRKRSACLVFLYSY